MPISPIQHSQFTNSAFHFTYSASPFHLLSIPISPTQHPHFTYSAFSFHFSIPISPARHSHFTYSVKTRTGFRFAYTFPCQIFRKKKQNTHTKKKPKKKKKHSISPTAYKTSMTPILAESS